MNYQTIVEEIFREVEGGEDRGAVASYIPELATVAPDQFGVCLATIEGRTFHAGKAHTRFSIQSIAKVLALVSAYRSLGETIWQRVGVEPSGTPFNSLVQLEADGGIPRNPFNNSGALVVCDILMSLWPKPKEEFLGCVGTLLGIRDIACSAAVLESEKRAGYRNIALCNLLKSLGNIENDPADVLDFYFTICSLEMTCEELARSFLFLANGGRLPENGRQIVSSSQAKRINAIMQTCGFYDESGEFSFRVGLPGKSGVGGGIIAIHPQKYTIATWSPRLNPKGNSYRGMRFLERFTTVTSSSIF